MARNKRKISRIIRSILSLKTWQLSIILILLLFVSATLLRLNNLGMVERRQEVVKADKAGDKQKTLEALQELRSYVNSHMNTSLGKGVYLEYSYATDRDAAIERAASANATNPNSVAYQQASIECRSRFAGGVESYRNDYVQCVIDRVGAMTQAEDPTEGIDLPKADAYRHNFVSPLWSTDLAGVAVLLSLLTALTIVCRLVFFAVAKMLIRKHYQRSNS